MPLQDIHATLDALRTLAVAAGDEIMKHFEGDIAFESKADESPVTAADRDAESVILPGLTALAPELPIVSEEAYAAGKSPEVVGRCFWLVDPLDGTREFINRRGEFTVNIGLIEDGTPRLGVVYAPATGDLYAGAVPGVAWHWSAVTRAEQTIAARTVPATGAVGILSRSHRGDAARMDAFLREHNVTDSLSVGSSLKFCEVARGRADVYPRFGETCEWDTAAGHAVLLAAGGCVRLMDGTPLTYGKSRFLNPYFIASGRPGTAAEA